METPTESTVGQTSQDRRLRTMFDVARILATQESLENMAPRLLASLVDTLEAADAGLLLLYDAGRGRAVERHRHPIDRRRNEGRRADARKPAPAGQLRAGDLEIHFARHTVTRRGEPAPLTRTEYGLLRQLALHPNRVILHQELLTNVWGPEYRDDVDYLRAYVRYLRRKLEDDPANPRYILTVPGSGYMLACPPQEPPAES